MGPLPFPTWASKLASKFSPARARAPRPAFGWWRLLAVAIASCQGEYALPPSACDDHCRAIQRADCSEDYPADCVRDCENSPISGACEPAQHALDDCYAAQDPSSFACVNDHSQPQKVCLPERRALSECLAPGSSPCFDQCLRQADACGADLSDCETACQQPAPGCELANNVNAACLLQYPTECRPWFEPDPRDPENVPCYYEGIDTFVCSQ